MLKVLIDALHLNEEQSKGRRVLRENQLHIFMPCSGEGKSREVSFRNGTGWDREWESKVFNVKHSRKVR